MIPDAEREAAGHSHNPVVRYFSMLNNRKIMREHTNGRGLNLLGWTATATMTAAALAFFVTQGANYVFGVR